MYRHHLRHPPPQHHIRHQVDALIEFAVQIYRFLEAYERDLIENIRKDLDREEDLNTSCFVRKRILRYLILDTNQITFQSLWQDYRRVYHELYRDFQIQNNSPTNDELFASREILEDTLVQSSDKVTFKHIFLQKAYQAFGVDFKPIDHEIRENCLFTRETSEERSREDTEPSIQYVEEPPSQVCQLM